MLILTSFPGIDATGTNPSTSGFQAAMNAAATSGEELYVPPGLYRVGTLNVPNGLVMRGYGNGGYGISVNKQSRIGLINGTNANMLNGAAGVAHVRFIGLHFDGNKNNNTSGNIINIADANPSEEGQWHIQDCFIDAAPQIGIYVGAGRRAVKITDCTVNYSGTTGIRMNGSDGHITRCIIGSNLEHGIGVGGTVCNVLDCDIYGNGTNGSTSTGQGIVVFSTITQVGIHNNRIDQNRGHGILVSGNNHAITVTGNILHGNSQHGNGTRHDIQVGSTTGTVTISDNTFGVDGNVPNKAGYGINLAAGATAQGAGNVHQPSATVNGLVNLPKSLTQTSEKRTMSWDATAGVIANMDRRSVTPNRTVDLWSGIMHLAGGIVIPAGVRITSISFLSGPTGQYGAENQWFCLVDQAGNVLTKTVDDGGAGWGGDSVKTLALSSAYVPATDMAVYVGCVVRARQPVDLRGVPSHPAVSAIPPVLSGRSNGDLRGPGSLGATAFLPDPTIVVPFCFVS